MQPHHSLGLNVEVCWRSQSKDNNSSPDTIDTQGALPMPNIINTRTKIVGPLIPVTNAALTSLHIMLRTT